tara:strand:+ start:774 stop:995 length:222 start_codon:yes stop_codon:yes gene_type:complete
VNKQIELVKKWLADNDSVSQSELKANSVNATAAYNAAYYAAAANAAYAKADAAANSAANWVAKYHELIKEPTL